MGFKGRPPKDPIDLDSLIVTLNVSKIQQKDPDLYDVIAGIISKARQQRDEINRSLRTITGDIEVLGITVDLASLIETIQNIIEDLQDTVFLTGADASLFFLQSRELL